MYKAKLSIHEITWSGFAIKIGEPTSQSKDPYVVEVSDNDEVGLNFAGKKYIIQVKEITGDSVKLHTDNLSVKSKDHGVTANPAPYEVVIPLNQTEIFYTPTLDMGAKWEIKLLSVEKVDNAILPKSKIRFPKAYFKETQKIIKQLEEKLTTKIIVYFVPDKHDISIEHPDFFLEQLKDIGHQEKISLILYSAGGSWEASLIIATMLRQHCNIFEVIVSSKCCSAATKLALAADKILMTSNGFLTPVDTQHFYKMNQDNNLGTNYTTISADSVQRILDLLNKSNSQGSNSTAYETMLKYIHPTLLGDILRTSKQSEQTGIKMMKMHPSSFDNNEEKIVTIAKHLVYDYPSHSYPIIFDEAKEIGLPAEKTDDDTTYLLWDLIKLYRAITRPAITNANMSLYHVEEVPVVIESINKRVTKRYSFNRQYFLTEKKWQTTNDNTQWIKLTPTDSETNPYEITPIEAEEIKEYREF